MNKDTKKTALVIGLTASAFLLAIIPVLEIICAILKKDDILWFFDWLNIIGFFHWGWFIVFCLAGYAIKEVWTGKIAYGCLYLKVITVIILLIVLLLAALWFFAMFLFELPT